MCAPGWFILEQTSFYHSVLYCMFTYHICVHCCPDLVFCHLVGVFGEYVSVHVPLILRKIVVFRSCQHEIQ